MGNRINRYVLYRRARRVFAEKVVAFPISRRPDRPRNKSAATIGTDIVQNVIDARRTERTFNRRICAHRANREAVLYCSFRMSVLVLAWFNPMAVLNRPESAKLPFLLFPSHTPCRATHRQNRS
jgi:hypothetical protein